MGFFYPLGATKKDIIRDRTKRYEDARLVLTTLAYCLRGNCLWMVKEVTSKTDKPIVPSRFIELDLLHGHGGDWGYKDMDEAMYPYYFSCPVSYLEMVPVANEKWREAVRAYAVRRSRKIEVGATYSVNALMSIKVLGLRPLRGVTNTGMVVRFSKAVLKEKIPSWEKETGTNEK